jgi:ABC-type uncharacterized transport system permease subunit
MNYFILLHIIIAVIAQALAIVSTIISTLFLIQQRDIKKKHLTSLMKQRFSLEQLDIFFTKTLKSVFLLFSISICSGFLLLCFFKPQTNLILLKSIWAILVWGWYFTSVMLKEKFFQSRTISAQMSSLGFLLLLSSCFGFLF